MPLFAVALRLLCAVALASSLCVVALATGCCRTPELPELEDSVPAGYVDLDEPKDTLAYLQEALDPQRPLDPLSPLLEPSVGGDVRLNRIYYLLSAKIRDELPYHLFVRHWPEIEAMLRGWVMRNDVMREVEVEVANGIEAKRVYLGREGSDEATWQPLLFVLEHDPVRFPQEQIALWRLRTAELLDVLRTNGE